MIFATVVATSGDLTPALIAENHCGVLDRIGADSIHLHVPYGVLDYMVLLPLARQIVATPLSGSLRARTAEAIALLE